ncbi:flagellar FliL protein [Sphingomonas naasensis]|uniref:Flagellar protein FliL n=1 Tax=Sphingomonas naasensis TaxID=1344951 RepID=A0A4S1WPQ5_9SPHN|nr:flagellar basal body-associated FliL family protein [Sphingomonas naasensis]NIJ20834.1 flagellar FliL protein [Sphingomonas naasensis]TGX43236.1 flagellar basal body protein FliL [Sphingomonas naasensis]
MSSPEIVEEGAEGAKPVQPKSKKKLLIIGAAAGVLLLGGGGGAAMMLSGGSAKAETAAEGHGEEAKPEAEAESGGHGGGEGAGKEAYVDVPAMIVNLRSPDGASRYLKIHFMIVPGPKGTADSVREKLPLILDAYQPFLRELRPEDLAGSAAVFRIKEEMLVRASDVAGAGTVKDILIQDLVQQ